VEVRASLHGGGNSQYALVGIQISNDGNAVRIPVGWSGSVGNRTERVGQRHARMPGQIRDGQLARVGTL